MEDHPKDWKKNLPKQVQNAFARLGCKLVPENFLLVLASKEGKVKGTDKKWKDRGKNNYPYAVLKSNFMDHSSNFGIFLEFLRRKFEPREAGMDTPARKNHEGA
jgi:hypothetical protein